MELETVYNSRSWRITEPLRKAAALQRSLRQKLPRLSHIRTLPKRLISKLVRILTLWIVANPRLYRLALKILNRFPFIKNRLKTQIYSSSQEAISLFTDKQTIPMSLPVRKIYMDLLSAIQQQQRNQLGE